jgi:polysaccharide export outer membrane protein
MAAILAAMLLLTACTAPGMKLDAKPSGRPAASEQGGLQVTLRKLDAQAVQTQRVRPLDTAALAQLMVDQAGPYRIGPQDVLLVTVWDHPEITLALGAYRTDNATGSLVDEAGCVFFPYVGRILVKGMSTSEARARLTLELAKTLQHPQVDVKVLAFRSQKIYVGGEVKAPATYNVTDVPFTLAEAVNRAGGFLPTADDSRLVLTRGGRSWVLDFQALMSRSNLGERILLQDGDTLMVPASAEDPVYMMGEVLKPGSLPLVHGTLSLAKALSDAGGIDGKSADARSIYVIRQGQAANSVDVYHLDARNPTALILADRFALDPRDIVYVDAGTLVRFNRVMDLLLPTVSTVVTGAVGAYEIRYFKRAF